MGLERYENPEVVHEMNVGRASPLREFVSLSLALVLGVVVFVVAVYLGSRWLLPWVPFAWEQRLAQPVASRLAAEVPGAPQRYLQELADALAAQMDLPPGMRVQVHWRADATPNAFATLGGHVTVFQGLVDVLESENALAMVLAHEIAHVQHRDPLVSAGSGLLVSLSLQALLGSGSDSVISQTSAALSQLEFSRQQERAADAAALRALQRHYGHVRGADGFFRAMLQRPGLAHHAPEWLSTHPDTAQRLQRIMEASEAAPADARLTPLPVFLGRSAKPLRTVNQSPSP